MKFGVGTKGEYLFFYFNFSNSEHTEFSRESIVLNKFISAILQEKYCQSFAGKTILATV